MTRTILPLAVVVVCLAAGPAPGQGLRPIMRPAVSAPDVRPFLPPTRVPLFGPWAIPPGTAYPVAPWAVTPWLGGGVYAGGLYGGGVYYPYAYWNNSTSLYYDPTPPTAPPLQGAGGNAPGSQVVVNPELPAELTVEFPAAPEVTLNGAAAEGEGTSRTLKSPPLKAGESYTFDVKAKWTADGKRYEWERTVTLGAGERSRVTVARGFPVKD